MKTQSVTFGGILVSVPQGWRDITSEVEATDPPFTLADTSVDVGALQFTIAQYVSGPSPNPSPVDLLEMAEEFGAAYGLSNPNDRVTVEEMPRYAAVSYRDDQGYFIRVWYIFDGKNFAKVTYTCKWGVQSEQLEQCEAILRTLRFV